MNPQSHITIPVTFATRIAAAGRLLLELADDLQRNRTEPSIRRKPSHVSKDQAWFWTDEWQAGEREVDEALARGDYMEFDNIEALIRKLHQACVGDCT